MRTRVQRRGYTVYLPTGGSSERAALDGGHSDSLWFTARIRDIEEEMGKQLDPTKMQKLITHQQ